MNFIRLIFLIFACEFIENVLGHGMMLVPPGRASVWRYFNSSRINQNDNELFCGGAGVQWNVNGGKCGLCGDDYRLDTPRPHEHGGTYGQGVIVKSYSQQNGIIPIGVKLTANHRGTFKFDICNMDIESESDECFGKNKLELVNGGYEYKVEVYTPGWFNTTLRIPEGLQCEHCVLRWTYRTGNNWGICDNGKGALGCGPQEHFRSCADIEIN